MPIDPICKMDVDPGEAITIRASEASGSGLDIRHFINLLYSVSYSGFFFYPVLKPFYHFADRRSVYSSCPFPDFTQR